MCFPPKAKWCWWLLVVGFFLGGKRVHTESYILFEALIEQMLEYEDLWLLTYPNFDQVQGQRVDFLAWVKAVAHVGPSKTDSYQHLSATWIELELLVEEAERDGLGCWTFMVGPHVWHPLTPKAVQALELVQVLPHLIYNNLLCHNVWLRRPLRAYNFQ